MKLVLVSLMFTWDQVIQYGLDLLSGAINRSTYEGDPIWNYTVQV